MDRCIHHLEVVCKTCEKVYNYQPEGVVDWLLMVTLVWSGSFVNLASLSKLSMCVTKKKRMVNIILWDQYAGLKMVG